MPAQDIGMKWFCNCRAKLTAHCRNLSYCRRQTSATRYPVSCGASPLTCGFDCTIFLRCWRVWYNEIDNARKKELARRKSTCQKIWTVVWTYEFPGKMLLMLSCTFKKINTWRNHHNKLIARLLGCKVGKQKPAVASAISSINILQIMPWHMKTLCSGNKNATGAAILLQQAVSGCQAAWKDANTIEPVPLSGLMTKIARTFLNAPLLPVGPAS